MEGRSLLRGGGLLLILALLRVGYAGLGRGTGLSPPPQDALPTLMEEALELEASGSAASRKMAEGEKLDPNRAAAEELLRLPGVSARVAGEIVRLREEKGGFGGAEDLLDVPGIGPVTLSRIQPHLDLSRGVPRGLGMKRAPPGPLDLNRAGAEELQSLPGIGPALAQRILESRARDGPFQRPEDLLRVRGIGPSTLQRIRALVRVGI